MIKITEATYNKWRDGWLVVTGMTGGERVALSHSFRVKWRLRDFIIEHDRDVSLKCEKSGIDAHLELHDDEIGMVFTRDFIDFQDGGSGFFNSQTLDVEGSRPSDDERADLRVLSRAKALVRKREPQQGFGDVNDILINYLRGTVPEKMAVEQLDGLLQVYATFGPSDKPKWECPGK